MLISAQIPLTGEPKLQQGFLLDKLIKIITQWLPQVLEDNYDGDDDGRGGHGDGKKKERKSFCLIDSWILLEQGFRIFVRWDWKNKNDSQTS